MADINTKPVTPAQALQAMRELAKIGEYSVMLHGAPGVGKTSIVAQLAEEMGGALKDIRLTTIDSCDLRGLPFLNHQTKETIWYKPEFLPNEGEKPGIIFLDELTTAEQRLQASAYSLLQERRIGEYKVPKGWFIVAAGNGAQHGAISNEMGTALADRLIHFQVVADPFSWIDDYARPRNLNAKVITFIKTKPDFFERCEIRVREDKMIDASPRGWERVARIMDAIGDTPKTRPVLQNIVSGIVGMETAATFFEITDLLTEQVQVEKLMKAKTAQERKALMPKSLEGIYGLAYALDAIVKDGETLQKAIEIATEIEDIEQKGEIPLPTSEVTTLAMEMLIQRGFDKKLEKYMIGYPVYQAYAEKRRKQGLAA